MSEEQDKYIEEVIRKRLESPKSYAIDGESITQDTPDELAKLLNLYKKASKPDPEPGKSSSPFRISVCRNNRTF